jgi:hypothetical protein
LPIRRSSWSRSRGSPGVRCSPRTPRWPYRRQATVVAWDSFLSRSRRVLAWPRLQDVHPCNPSRRSVRDISVRFQDAQARNE